MSKWTSDYILVQHTRRFKDSMKDKQTLTKADINSKHKLLFAKICTRLKKIKKLRKGKPRWNVENLHA